MFLQFLQQLSLPKAQLLSDEMPHVVDALREIVIHRFPHAGPHGYPRAQAEQRQDHGKG